MQQGFLRYGLLKFGLHCEVTKVRIAISREINLCDFFDVTIKLFGLDSSHMPTFRKIKNVRTAPILVVLMWNWPI